MRYDVRIPSLYRFSQAQLKIIIIFFLFFVKVEGNTTNDVMTGLFHRDHVWHTFPLWKHRESEQGLFCLWFK